MTETFHTQRLQDWLTRMNAGESEAKNQLLQACQNRLEFLVRKMLKRNPTVQQWADTGDVFQNTSLRLLRALENTPVDNTREFFNLATAIIRRELIDLSRHCIGSRGRPQTSADDLPEPAAPGDEGSDLSKWTALHEAVEALPAEEREVFGLTFYHAWSQQEIAELFGIDERTVRRRFGRAIESLRSALNDELP